MMTDLDIGTRYEAPAGDTRWVAQRLIEHMAHRLSRSHWIRIERADGTEVVGLFDNIDPTTVPGDREFHYVLIVEGGYEVPAEQVTAFTLFNSPISHDDELRG